VVCDHPAANTVVFGPASLGPGEVANFTASFPVPTNLTGCSVTATVTVTGNDICTGASVKATASGACPILTVPGILVTKQCPASPVAQGALLTFKGTVKNTGNSTLTNVVVYNNQPAANTVVFRTASLSAGQTTSFTGSYKAPTNCCDVIDTLLATGNDLCSGQQVSDTATAVCPILYKAAIKLTRDVVTNAVTPGATLPFKGTVANTGNITLVNVTVVNDHGGTALGPISLAPCEVVHYAGHYTVPSDFCGKDIVTAQGTSLCGATQVTDSCTLATTIVTSPSLEVTKSCPTDPIVRCSPVTYTCSLYNDGNVTLTGIMVYDNQPTNCTPVFGPLSLPPGGRSIFTFTNTSPDSCDCCALVDTITATAHDFCSGTKVTSTSTAVCDYQIAPALAVSVTCPSSLSESTGYTGLVKNTGDITLTNVVVVANLPANTVLVGPIALAPGETQDFSGQFGTTVENPMSALLVTATGADTCQGTTVSAQGSCSGPRISLIAPTVAPVLVSPGAVKISWSSVPGVTYRVQYKSETSDTWHNLPGDVTALCSTTSKTDTAKAPRRLYQVIVLE
jgi:hypothetical protein